MDFPYGLWSSPISSDFLSQGGVSFQELHCDSSYLYWTESRPSEKGRNALLCYQIDHDIIELFPHMNIKTRVHEYGGGAFFPSHGCLCFYDDKTHTLYFRDLQGNLLPILEDTQKRYADFQILPEQNAMICVCEDHTNEKEVKNYLVYLDLSTKTSYILHEGGDFYASPRLSPNGHSLAFLSWSFPSMPWEECTLHIAHINQDHSLTMRDTIGSKHQSISQLCWMSNDALIYDSNATGYSNLYLWDSEKSLLLYHMAADFSYPLWILGKSTFKPLLFRGKKAILCCYCEYGVDRLDILLHEEGTLQKLDLPFTSIKTLDILDNKTAYFIGGSPTIPLSIVQLDLETLSYKILTSSLSFQPDIPSFFSMPELIFTPSSLDGEEIFGFYYPPHNPLCSAAEGDLPPLIIKCHGGPTAHVQPVLNLEIQFWTTRGFAFLDVNYRGSSGHGNHYREKLHAQWGLIDAHDCRDLALLLVKLHKVNPHYLFIRGGSAGGFTALCASFLFKDFSACTSFYGVTDLSLLAKETHKFEKHYLDSLIGPYPSMESTYLERSPIHNWKKISCPILFLHGEEDPIVPVSQAKNLHQKLVEHQISSEMVIFADESHGFRKADTIRQALDTEYAFYLKKMGLKLRTEL